MSESFDLIVIGAGPGGTAAARRGAELGLSTALVEQEERLGGTCLLRGCIPTKALIQAAEVWQLCRKGSRPFGVTTEGAAFDWSKVLGRKELAITKGAKGLEQLMRQAGVTVIRGRGRLDGPQRVLVDGPEGERPLSAGRIVLAAGSTTGGLPGITPDGARILTSDHLLDLPAPPASLLVLGAGAVGVELATVMQTFGCKVTLVELLDQVLPLEDPECGAVVEQALKRQGAKVLTGMRAAAVEVDGDEVVCRLEATAGGGQETVRAERLLVAVGRRPVTAGLGLESVGITPDARGTIPVDAMMQTTAAGVYAIGDIVPTQQLAHLASQEALVAVGHAAGRPLPPIRYHLVPSCTYSSPEVASVGLREDAARAAGHAVITARHPFAAVGKASILNEPHGFAKIVADAETRRVLGVHLVGPRVTEMIGEAVVALGLGADLDAWQAAIHPHPTLNEVLGEALAELRDGADPEA